MAKQDFYKILGVAETAPQADIKKAYRKLAKRYHPDVNAGDKAKEAKFKEVSEAYETIGDDKKRQAYDAQRRSPFGAGGPGDAGGFSGFGGAGFPGGGAGGRTRVDVRDFGDIFGGAGAAARGGASGGGIGDMFADLFGGAAATEARPARGQDVKARLDVELPVAALGGELHVTVEGKKYSVKIPGGVAEGQLIRLGGKGRPGARGAPAGDLLLEVHVKPHERFRRLPSAPDDLEVDVPVPVDGAILGDKVEVPTLDGKVTVTVPPGTSSGMKLRLKGKGARNAAVADQRGDLYAVIQITVPRDLPPKARELIEEFAKLTRK